MARTRRKCPECGKVWTAGEDSENNPERVCIGCRGKAIAEALAKVRLKEEIERKRSDRYRPDRPTPTYIKVWPQVMVPYAHPKDYEPYGGTGNGGGNEHLRLPPPIEISLEPEPKKPKKPRKPRKKKEKPAPQKRDKWETVKV